MVKFISKHILTGMITILPVALTLYLLVGSRATAPALDPTTFSSA